MMDSQTGLMRMWKVMITENDHSTVSDYLSKSDRCGVDCMLSDVYCTTDTLRMK
jgi:hypothetical protein